uniref:Microtubule associated protein 9 n=1 Tax=Leptobrachium leishanense TaxID=445787 RepID=A0A8C5Q2T6_9ANUR
MDSDEEEFSTTLAYTKSPKVAKRTSFQDELKRAINARVSRQQAIEEPANSDYSDEFESDDSLDEPPDEKKTFQLTAMKTIRNFSIPDDDDDDYLPKKMSFIKSKNDFNKRDGSDKTRDNTKNSLLKSPKEKKKEIQLFDEKESKPIPKPRETRLKSPTSTQDVSVSLSDEKFKPTPQQRHFLKKSSHKQDKDSSQEDEIHTSTKHASFSTPSSLSRLNNTISSSDTLDFAARQSPEGHRIMDPKIKTRALSDGENNLTVSKDGSQLFKDLKVKAKETFESHDSVVRSQSALDMMLKSINEKTKPQENNHSLEETSDHITVKSQTLVDGRDGKEENPDFHSLSIRSLPSQRTKKAFKHRTQMSAKSRYLGTLTVLDKAKENSCDVEPADVLRATVYQNWLEKKKVFIQELHKIKKFEELKQKEKASKDETVKKEDAAAAFHAWKSEKKKDVKKMLMRQMEDEEKKIKEVQETIRRKEDAQKAFEKWKEHKEDYLKEKVYKEKKTEMEKRRKEQDSAKEKKTSNMSALRTWNEEKEHVLREKKKEKMSEKTKLEEEKSEKEEQEKRAMEIYEEWLEKKEQRERNERKKKKFQFLSDDDPPPPWSPPGKTIPTGK